MVRKDIIDIKALNMEELTGVVSIYPWYAGARKELCNRMAALGEGAWSDERYAEQALYFGSRKIAAMLARAGKDQGCRDENIELPKPAPAEEPVQQSRIVMAGGDYFSREQYESVRRADDGIFSSFASKAREEGYQEPVQQSDFEDICTESLAEIYLQQDYVEQAVQIYSKLGLRYPEKSAYFAALIEKINRKTI